MDASPWQRIGLPSFAFMSVVIGGGYATGREIVEFFMQAGPRWGFAGLAVTAIVWSVIAALSFDLARERTAYDYQRFFRELLGRAWWLFDLCYIAILVLVLCVLGAAAGEIVARLFGWPVFAGAVVLLLAVTVVLHLGADAVERFFSIWGAAMTLAYVLVLVAGLWMLRDPIHAALDAPVSPQRHWAIGGLQYAGYNLAVIPAILACARHQRTRRDSLWAGLLCGPVAVLPGLCLYVSLLGVYPAALQAPIPLHLLLERLGAPWLEVALQVIIFGTLVQTGVGVLQGFTERLFSGRVTTPRRDQWRRTIASFAVTVFALFVADRIGIIALVARGYGTLSWVVIATFVVPLLWNRLTGRSRATGEAPASVR